ncbi:uncharacterized protein LOC126821597 [Patella vulgata]|uniref:uncharacterized protein LOC126821597 n=1 Tax=Patella vulgata TaxID=6465 RepID=UPI00217FF97C|nr:uncharacterized protein LOC126821597 [Patella vulgata]
MEKFTYQNRTMGFKERHAVKLQDLLYQQMQEDSEFCDVTLLIGDVKVKAHWCVLVGCPFFQSLHDSGMKESFEGSIRLSYGEPWAMKEALKFLYIGTVQVDFNHVKELLEAAEYLQITDMKKCCNDYLHLIDITDTNCVQLALLSSLYDLDLYNKAFQYLRGHLPSVLEGEDALTLTKESVLSLLTDETLTYVPQENFFIFINKWVNQELEERQQHYNDLFLALNLENIPRTMLTDQFESNTLISKNEECKSKLSQLLAKYASGDLIECKDTKDVIILCGGSGPGIYIGHILLPFSDYMSLNNVFGYVVDEKRWTEFSPMPCAIRRPLMVCDDVGNIFIYDQSNNLETNIYIYQYTTAERTWSSIKVILPENSEPFAVLSMVMCQNRLFFLASGNVAKPSSSSRNVKSWQCFLLEVNRENGESKVRAILFPRNENSEASACVIANRYICVIASKLGDKVKPRQKINSVCVCYEVATDRVTKLPKGCNNEQYLFDYDGNIMTARPGKTNVRVYSFTKRKWEMRRDLAIPLPVELPERTDYAFVNHKNEFYIFGGKGGEAKEPLKSALTFSHETKSWEKLEDIPEAIFGSGICVGKLPSDMVRCHIKCPHCVYSTPRSRANYNLVHSDLDDEDDDDDYSLDDYSYDYNSDMSLWEEDDDEDNMELIDDPDDYWFY